MVETPQLSLSNECARDTRPNTLVLWQSVIGMSIIEDGCGTHRKGLGKEQFVIVHPFFDEGKTFKYLGVSVMQS